MLCSWAIGIALNINVCRKCFALLVGVEWRKERERERARERERERDVVLPSIKIPSLDAGEITAVVGLGLFVHDVEQGSQVLKILHHEYIGLV